MNVVNKHFARRRLVRENLIDFQLVKKRPVFCVEL